MVAVQFSRYLVTFKEPFMADEAIKQHQKYARGDGIEGDITLASPFKQVNEQSTPRGATMLDSQRGASRGGKITHA